MSILPRRYTERVCCRCGTPWMVRCRRSVDRASGEVRWLPVHSRAWCDECDGRVKR
mgnify:CR=1 FL=1